MKTGIVGCGNIAQLHAATISANVAGAEIRFCDRNEHKARDLTGRFSPGQTVYTDVATMLREENPDAVHVLTQIHSHAHCDYNWSAGDGEIPYGGGDHWAYSLRGGILQNLADHPASLALDVIDGVDDFSVRVSRREDLPKGSPDLIHAAAYNQRQIVSFTMSFGHGNTHGQMTYYLEGATVQVDLRSHVLTVRAGRGPQSLPKRFLANTKLSWDIGVGGGAYVVRRLAGRMPREPGVVELIKNFYDLINGRAPALVSATTTRRVIHLLGEAWASVSGTSDQES